MKCLKILLCISGVLLPSLVEAKDSGAKTMSFALPLAGRPNDSQVRGEYNYQNQAAVALEWSEWGYSGGRYQELSKLSQEKNPGTSMMSRGRGIGLMFERFSQPNRLAGFHWGLGMGYRTADVQWHKSPRTEANAYPQDKYFVEPDGKFSHNVNLTGNTYSGRLGYRYVSEDWGVMLGAHLGLKHFQGHAKDKNDKTDSTNYTTISYLDKRSLERKMATMPSLGVEVGLAL